jgi:glycosyltransferase involved in cell wall biosynthesis
MHMIFISSSYYPHIGGVEYVVKSISERLVEMGHKIAVLAGEPALTVSTRRLLMVLGLLGGLFGVLERHIIILGEEMI